ncbi:MAG: PatB family C-S lyase [Methylotenera sp.]|nr:PatB family C-S lyase [Methylotenera sp.]
MSELFNFDQPLSRDHTNSLKYDARQSVFGKQDVIPMWVADMDFATPIAVTEALRKRAEHPIYGYSTYPESLYDALIQWLKCRHQWHVERDWIVMSPGVVPSLHAAVMAFTQADSPVIIQPPVYFPFFTAATHTGRQVLENPLQFANNRYQIDFDHLAQCATASDLLLFCSPHNPVGRVWRQDELTRLLAIAEQNNLVVFSDEIHADLIYPDYQHQVLAKLANNQSSIITAVAPSKTFNIPGLNLSALIVPDANHRQAITRAFDTLHASAANPFSITAFEAAYTHGEKWLDALLIYLTQTRYLVSDYLTQHLPQIKLISPEGTYLLWLDCNALGMSDSQLKALFTQQAGVGLSPGVLFGHAGCGFMRMNIGTSQQTVLSALERIKQAISG